MAFTYIYLHEYHILRLVEAIRSISDNITVHKKDVALSALGDGNLTPLMWIFCPVLVQQCYQDIFGAIGKEAFRLSCRGIARIYERISDTLDWKYERKPDKIGAAELETIAYDTKRPVICVEAETYFDRDRSVTVRYIVPAGLSKSEVESALEELYERIVSSAAAQQDKSKALPQDPKGRQSDTYILKKDGNWAQID